MRLFAAFAAHEWRTQLRSLRFRAMAIAYAAVGTAPALGVYFLQHRVTFVIGPSLYGELLTEIQPLLTALLAGTIAVDAITRERDEGSLAVVSLAPMSSTAYALYRWLAVVTSLLPVTLVPGLATAAASLQATHAIAPALAWGWLLHTLPVLLVISALTLSFGTISGRTVAGLFLALALLPFLLGFVDDHLARSHRHLEAGGEFVTMRDTALRTLFWTMRGYSLPNIPTDAGFALHDAVDELAPRAGLLVAWTAFVLAATPSFLRRTRPDLRPWIPRENHPLRTFIRFVNRVRNEFAPDAVRERPEWIAIAAGLVLLVIPPVLLIQRFDRYAALAADRYAAETRADKAATAATLITESARIDGTIQRDGSITTRTTLVLRNDGAAPATRVSLALNPAVRVVRPTNVTHQWERADLALVPPLAPGARRQLVFDCEGAPAAIDFPFNPRVIFAQAYARFARAKDAVEMTDFSRSVERRLVTPAAIRLSAADLGPVPRYADWTADPYPSETSTSTFTADTAAAAIPLEVHLTTPPSAVTADSCGTLSQQGRIASQCVNALADYRLIGGPLTTTTIGPDATLAYLPPHEELARIHAPSLASAHALALKAWPGLPIARRAVFVERATVRDEFYWENVRLSIGSVSSSGALHALPEQMFLRRKAVDPSIIAAAMILRTIAHQRAVVANQQSFFQVLWTSIALTRVGQDRTSPVVPALDGRPDTLPLLEQERRYSTGSRMARVLAEVENRAGSDAFNAGITDFLAAGPAPGSARELLDAIGHRAGIDLSRVYTDYFAGDALPRLTLEDVAFHREGSVWRVTGTLHNTATGESFCPIVLRTEGESVRTVVRIDSNQRVPFELRSALRPRTLQLDPERVCYRWAAIGTVDAVDDRSGE